MLNRQSMLKVGGRILLVFLFVFLANFLGDLFVHIVLAEEPIPLYCKGLCVIPYGGYWYCELNDPGLPCMRCYVPTSC